MTAMAVKALITLHRWLGIGGGALFVLWFASGIAMMYVRMPEVTPAERLAHTPALDPALVHVGLAEPPGCRSCTRRPPYGLRMLGPRPVYEFGGRRPVGRSPTGSRLARGRKRRRARPRARVPGPGQRRTRRMPSSSSHRTNGRCSWRAHLPLHRLRVGDDAATDSYVSSVTGEVVMQTTRRSRLLAYLGPVPHWLYLPVLRRNGPLWPRWSSASRRSAAWPACRGWAWASGGCRSAGATAAMAARP